LLGKNIEIDTLLDAHLTSSVSRSNWLFIYDTPRCRLFHRPLSITQRGANRQTREKWQSHSAFHYIFKERCADVDIILIYN